MIRSPISRRRFLGGAAAVGLTIHGLPKQLARADGKVNFYNWSTYIDEETIPEFENGTGIEVVEDFFGDNDELFNKLRNGNPGYDIIVPSGSTLHRMRLAGLVQELNHSAIPNKSNLNPIALNPDYDPGNVYSLPYMGGSYGIGYRISAMNGNPPTSWKDVFDSDRFSGRLAILSESDSMIGLVKKYLGYSSNDKDLDLLNRVGEVLERQKPHIRAIAEDNGQDLLATGEVDVTIEYDGDISQLKNEDPDVNYIIPNEGTILWTDTLAIPTDAPNLENAHKFINTLLDADVGARIAEYIEYATPNKAAFEKTSAGYKNNPIIFPPEEILKKSEYTTYPGEDYNDALARVWDRFLAS